MSETHHRLKSLHLDNERSLWLLAPKDGRKPSRLAVFLDAERYRDKVGAPSLLDEAISAGEFGDTLFVFVSDQSPGARWRECPCHPPFAEFVNGELPAFLETVHPGITAARERVLIGLSYTGLAAAYAAFSAPTRWTRVISQSGSHWSDDEALTARYAALTSPLPVKFHLDIGTRETQENVRHREDVLQVASQIDAVRRFRDVLRATGHEVDYVEFDGGHEYAAWRLTLPGALKLALPRIAATAPAFKSA